MPVHGAPQSIAVIKSILGTEQILESGLIGNIESAMSQRTPGVIVAPRVLTGFLNRNENRYVICVGIRL